MQICEMVIVSHLIFCYPPAPPHTKQEQDGRRQRTAFFYYSMEILRTKYRTQYRINSILCSLYFPFFSFILRDFSRTLSKIIL